jgi:hypothetical protein
LCRIIFYRNDLSIIPVSDTAKNIESFSHLNNYLIIIRLVGFSLAERFVSLFFQLKNSGVGINKFGIRSITFRIGAGFFYKFVTSFLAYFDQRFIGPITGINLHGNKPLFWRYCNSSFVIFIFLVNLPKQLQCVRIHRFNPALKILNQEMPEFFSMNRVNSSAANAAKIPLQLALSLQNAGTRPIRSTIQILDECMFPTLLQNTEVHVEQLQDASEIESGGLYFIVDNNLRGFLRRASLVPDEDYIRLYCDHPDKNLWPAHLMRIKSITAIFKVVI